MTREEVIKIINDDPPITAEQGAAILARFNECEKHLLEDFDAIGDKNHWSAGMVMKEFAQACFIVGYVYASLELNGEVK